MTKAEYERLASLLAALPTKEAEDQALLGSGMYPGVWWAPAGPAGH